jgi:hypothetical protein
MRIGGLRPNFGAVHRRRPYMKKTLVTTFAVAVLLFLASAAALFTLAAMAGTSGNCSNPSPAELRQAADPAFAAELEKLARCGH